MPSWVRFHDRGQRLEFGAPTAGSRCWNLDFASRLLFERLNRRRRVCGATAQSTRLRCTGLGMERCSRRTSYPTKRFTEQVWALKRLMQLRSTRIGIQPKSTWHRPQASSPVNDPTQYGSRTHQDYAKLIFVAAGTGRLRRDPVTGSQGVSKLTTSQQYLSVHLPTVLNSTDLARQHRAAAGRRGNLHG